MAGLTRTPRSRGLISGLLLFLLGGWGGLGPFVAPYFRLGFTPDHPWAYTSGRLYLSAVPGAVVLLAGLIIMVTRSRAIGGCLAVIAALAGAWFIAGSVVLTLLPARISAGISAGKPIQAGAAAATWSQLGLLTGVGTLVVLFAGLALGRFSLAAVKDLTGEDDDFDYDFVGGPEEATSVYPPGPAPLRLPVAADPHAVTEEF